MWKSQVSLALPFTRAKLKAFSELSSLRALTLASNKSLSDIFVPTGIPNALLPDLVPIVPRLGPTLQSLIINEGLSHERWGAFSKTAFGGGDLSPSSGGLRLLTRLELLVPPVEAIGALHKVARQISQACPLLVQLKLLCPGGGGWTEAFAEFGVLERLERLETSADPCLNSWSCLRSMRTLSYLGVRGWSVRFILNDPDQAVLEHVVAADLLFIPVYSSQYRLLCSESETLTERLLDEYHKKAIKIPSAAAIDILIGQPNSESLRKHPAILDSLHSKVAAAPDRVYLTFLESAASSSHRTRASLEPYGELVPLIFAYYLNGGSSVSSSMLPATLVVGIRAWIQSCGPSAQLIVLKVIDTIRDLVSPAELVSQLIRLDRLGEALELVQANVAKGPRYAEALILANTSHYDLFIEPLHALLRTKVSTIFLRDVRPLACF